MMINPRADALAARLEKGRQKTFEIFNRLTPEQWQQPLYVQPAWQIQSLLAHFASAERQLRLLAQDVAAGGPGAPPDLDVDRFNAGEQRRLEGQSPSDLLASLDQERRQTIAWVSSLDEACLDRVGRHPVLGQVSVEVMLGAIYAHQLLHMRELSKTCGNVG